MDLSEKEKEHVVDIIEREVSFFNGWGVSQETQREVCKKAADKAYKYIRRKLTLNEES